MFWSLVEIRVSGIVVFILLDVCTGFVKFAFVFVSGSTVLDRFTDEVRGVEDPLLEGDVVGLFC